MSDSEENDATATDQRCLLWVVGPVQYWVHEISALGVDATAQGINYGEEHVQAAACHWPHELRKSVRVLNDKQVDDQESRVGRVHQIVVQAMVAWFVEKRPVNAADDDGEHRRVVVQEPVAFKDVCHPVCSFNAATVMMGCEARTQSCANHRAEEIPARQINEHV